MERAAASVLTSSMSVACVARLMDGASMSSAVEPTNWMVGSVKDNVPSLALEITAAFLSLKSPSFSIANLNAPALEATSMS